MVREISGWLVRDAKNTYDSAEVYWMDQAFPTPTDDGALERGIREMLGQIEVLRSQMQRDQAKIEQLKKETAEIKAESAALQSETRAVLATLTKAA